MNNAIQPGRWTVAVPGNAPGNPPELQNVGTLFGFLDVYAQGSPSWIMQILSLADNAAYAGVVFVRKNINNAGWTAWYRLATATMPQIYELPLSTDFANVPDDISKYWKNQFGEVTFQIRAKYIADGQGYVHQIGTLPVGFRPMYYVEIPVVVNTGSFSLGIFAIDTLGGCYLHYYAELPSDSLVSCGGTFLAQ